MICKIVCSTLLVFIFIQIIVEARVPLKNLYEQHVDFLTEHENRAMLDLDEIYFNAVALSDIKLNTLNMSRDVLYRCEDTIMTRLIGLYIEVRENFIDCKEPALDHINRRSIKYWQYEERRRQFMLCVERLRDNYNTSSISSIPTNSQCDNL